MKLRRSFCTVRKKKENFMSLSQVAQIIWTLMCAYTWIIYILHVHLFQLRIHYKNFLLKPSVLNLMSNSIQLPMLDNSQVIHSHLTMNWTWSNIKQNIILYTHANTSMFSYIFKTEKIYMYEKEFTNNIYIRGIVV